MLQKPIKPGPYAAEIAYLRGHLDRREARSRFVHVDRRREPSPSGTCQSVATARSCNCGEPTALRAGIIAERAILNEIEGMLADDSVQVARRGLHLLKMLLLAYPAYRLAVQPSATVPAGAAK